MARKTYYNPVLDPIAQARMTEAMRAAVLADEYEAGGPLNDPDEEHPANLVSSLDQDGMHYPALDIDIPCRFVPSSTPGHGHLYFDALALSWDAYKIMLVVLSEVGVLEKKYVSHSITRGQTLLRPEGVTKENV